MFFSEIVGEYGQRPLYRMLGYFSIIGLLRVHVLLGDYTLGLKVMDNVELNQKVCNIYYLICLSQRLLAVTIHPCNCMPCHNILLRWFLLHDAQTLPRRNSHIRNYLEFHYAYAAIPHKELPI